MNQYHLYLKQSINEKQICVKYTIDHFCYQRDENSQNPELKRIYQASKVKTVHRYNVLPYIMNQSE